jgi:hypothetical protein
VSQSDFSSEVVSYTGRVKIAATKAMPLALLLEKHAPDRLSILEKKKLEALRAAGAEVEKAQAERDQGSGVSVQPLRSNLASAYAAVDLTLAGISELPAKLGDRGERAIKLRAVLLPDGREFTRSAAYEACMYSRRVIARIEQKKLAGEMKDLLGPEFLDAIRSATDDLAEAIGLGDSAHEIPSSTNVADALARFTTALAGYTRALSADVDENDEASRQRFLRAVAPIDQFRSTHGPENDAAPAGETPPATNATTPPSA